MGATSREHEKNVVPGMLARCGNCGYVYGEHDGDSCPRGRKTTFCHEPETLAVAPTATTLPTEAAARKAVPIYSGFVRYFPDAMAAVAQLSRVGNDQHNPGKPLHWDRSKSGDELDAATRHLLEAGTIDTDGVRHSTKLAWRAMANLQKEIERERT